MAWNRIAGFQQANRSLLCCTANNGASQWGKWMLWKLVFMSLASQYGRFKTRTGVIRYYKSGWRSRGPSHKSDCLKWKNTQSIDQPLAPVTWEMSESGWAAVHAFPWMLLVIHKWRLIPVKWCHLHHLPKGVICKTGPWLYLRAYGVCYIGQCLYLFVFACVWESENGRVCCYAFLHILPLLSSLHMK